MSQFVIPGEICVLINAHRGLLRPPFLGHSAGGASSSWHLIIGKKQLQFEVPGCVFSDRAVALGFSCLSCQINLDLTFLVAVVVRVFWTTVGPAWKLHSVFEDDCSPGF